MKYSKVSRSESEQLLWAAVEIAAGAEVEEDRLDVGRYVASRGDAAVDAFLGEVDVAVASLREAGVADALTRSAMVVESDGRRAVELSEAEMDQVLQSQIIAGRRWFEILVADPEAAVGPEPLTFVDLPSLVRIAGESEVFESPIWVEKRGDRRRDGRLWLDVDQGLGVGLSWNSWPWTVWGVAERYRKGAIVRSLAENWREWRTEIGAKRVDLTIEYWLPGDEVEGVEVVSRGSAPFVVVRRHLTRFGLGEDPLAVARRESDDIFRLLRNALLPSS